MATFYLLPPRPCLEQAFGDLQMAGGATEPATGPTAKRAIEQFTGHSCQYREDLNLDESARFAA